MKLNIIKPLSELIINQSKFIFPHTKATFKALADAIIPGTPESAEKLADIHSFGGLDAHIDEYLIWSLNHYLSLSILNVNLNIDLANATASMLEISARNLIDSQGNQEPVDSVFMQAAGAFAALTPNDRFRSITLLEDLKVDLESLPIPFYKNADFVLAITAGIAILATIGYYTEWSGYGSTRMEIPEKRKLEHFPTSWEQAGYPGPSRGYHALRGYLLKEFNE